MANISVAGDYAVLESKNFKAYYGYERIDESEDWCFVAEFNGKEIKIPSSRLGVQNKFDVTECLLKGIAWIMTKYSINSGSQTTSKIEEVLQWAKDGKWHILEGHPLAIDEAESQLLDLLTTVRNLRKVNESVKRVLEWHDENLSDGVERESVIKDLRSASKNAT